MRETSLALSIPEVSARDEQAFLPDPPDRLQHRRPARSLSLADATCSGGTVVGLRPEMTQSGRV